MPREKQPFRTRFPATTRPAPRCAGSASNTRNVFTTPAGSGPMRFKVPPGGGVTATGGPYTGHVDGSTKMTVVTPVRRPWPLLRPTAVLPDAILLTTPTVGDLTD